jgi:hypothetical protein
VDTNPQNAQISIVLDYEIFLEILCNSKMFSHKIVINMLVVPKLLKAGDKDQKFGKDLTKKEDQDF